MSCQLIRRSSLTDQLPIPIQVIIPVAIVFNGLLRETDERMTTDRPPSMKILVSSFDVSIDKPGCIKRAGFPPPTIVRRQRSPPTNSCSNNHSSHNPHHDRRRNVCHPKWIDNLFRFAARRSVWPRPIDSRYRNAL